MSVLCERLYLWNKKHKHFTISTSRFRYAADMSILTFVVLRSSRKKVLWNQTQSHEDQQKDSPIGPRTVPEKPAESTQQLALLKRHCSCHTLVLGFMDSWYENKMLYWKQGLPGKKFRGFKTPLEGSKEASRLVTHSVQSIPSILPYDYQIVIGWVFSGWVNKICNWHFFPVVVL